MEGRSPADVRCGFASRANGVACNFKLIVHDQKIWRVQAAMHQVVAVKECQGVEGRKQQFAHFVGRKSPLRKNLSQGLLCVLHDNEQKGVAAELASSEIQQADQMRMREAGSRSPIRELRLALHRV